MKDSIELIKELWSKRNPCHDYDDEGNDRFWGTVKCIIEDYNEEKSKDSTTTILERFIKIHLVSTMLSKYEAEAMIESIEGFIQDEVPLINQMQIIDSIPKVHLQTIARSIIAFKEFEDNTVFGASDSLFTASELVNDLKQLIFLFRPELKEIDK